ncbi:PepSY-like domain-containing protein [Mesonia hippocampi]|jgi:hypothetical protein|uniref:PepSY-like domain-containing protein n=1 Tax=Mesonia hippocampi TaxID=1628250 RepID=UPI003F9B8A92
MKSKTIQLVALMVLGTGTIFAQDIPSSQVPSVIVNNFKKEFPKANDIEWEMQGDLYNVDFEIGWFTDYEAWFTASGKLIKQTQEISKSDIPKAVANAIKTQYKEYRIEDAKKIIENGVETYKIELEKWDEDFDVIYSKSGNLIK